MSHKQDMERYIFLALITLHIFSCEVKAKHMHFLWIQTQTIKHSFNNSNLLDKSAFFDFLPPAAGGDVHHGRSFGRSEDENL